ncbi:MAG: hypothetical protein ABJB02_00420 [Dokdonella sp.]
MNKFNLIVMACSVALAACAAREPSNAELTTLLHRQDASATAVDAPLDASAVMCLRSWSGDSELTKNLPAAANMDSSKGQCRSRLDGWLADAARNPTKLDFAQVSTPAATRRAMAMLVGRGGADASVDASQSTLATSVPAPTPPAVATEEQGPAPDIETVLTQAGEVCQKAKELMASGTKDGRLERYADFCGNNLSQTRTKVDQVKLSGDSAQLEQLARSMDKMVSTGRALARNVENKAAGH